MSFFKAKARLTFTKLEQVFIETLIFCYFNSKRYTRIEMDVFGYAIGKVFSQLTLDNLVQWNLVTFFSSKKKLVTRLTMTSL